MSVQLLPFQKLVDIPDVAQRHRCAIRRLAITSIVLMCTLVFLSMASIISSGASQLYTSFSLLLIVGIPSMVILLFLVSISSVVALCNTDKWVSADVCCNLMRSNPACCTRSCSGRKHCCARLSNAHIRASVLASLICLLFLAAIFTGCGEPADNYSDEHEYGTGTGSGYTCNDDIAANHLGTGNEKIRTCPRTGTCVVPLAKGGGTVTFTCTRSGWACLNGKCDVAHEESCGVSAGFEITTIILLISLVATTARSAYLLRQIEQSMPEVAFALPPGKMVTQADQLAPVVPHSIESMPDVTFALSPGQMVAQADQLVPVVPHSIDTGNDETSKSTDGTVVLSTPV